MSQETGLENLDSRHKQLPLTNEGNELFASATRTKVCSNFVKGGTEVLRRTESPKAECGVVALLDSSMVLFDPAVEVSNVLVLYVRGAE